MKTKVIVRVDAKLAHEARILAAREGNSLSSTIETQLRNFVDGKVAYDAARKSALRRLKLDFELDWEKPATRDELHDRFRDP